MSHIVEIPDPLKQHEKTPAKIRKLIEELDEHGLPTGRKMVRWINFIEGIGEDARIIRWHEFVEEIELVTGETYEDLRKLYRKLAGEDYDGKHSKKGIVEAIIKLYWGEEWGGTLGQLLQNLRTRIVEKGRWGLGCPNNCGRFWLFKPHPKYGFIFCDPAAYSGFDEEGSPSHGYLKVDFESGTFTCDRCSAGIKLKGK